MIEFMTNYVDFFIGYWWQIIIICFLLVILAQKMEMHYADFVIIGVAWGLVGIFKLVLLIAV